MNDNNNLCAIVEALIFMSERPINLKKLQAHIGEDVNIEEIREAVACLQKEYLSERHGFSLVEVAGGFQFRTKQNYAEYIKKFSKTTSLVLSPTAMEVLAVVAYRGPIAKSDIDKIRGVDSSYIVRGLMEKGLVRISGRSEQLGRSSLYVTTQRFLEMFNLVDLSDLPPEHELEEMSKEEVGSITDIRTLSHNQESSYADELEELDRLGEEIKKISSDTDFTKALKSERRPLEDGAFKSAFEILAEHMGKKDIAAMNARSVQSESLSIRKLMSEKTEEEPLPEGGPALEKGEARLDDLRGKMMDDARRLDLDLDFMNEE